MRILALSLVRPGHVLHTVVDFWKSQGHEVDDVRVKAGYLREYFGVYRPFRRYDIFITAEPLIFLNVGGRLGPLGKAKKEIFWRIDLKSGLIRELVDREIVREADETWSIVPKGRKKNERYVPALLRREEIIEGGKREDKIIWSGPDIDGMLEMTSKALENRELVRTSWKAPLIEEELKRLMGTCKVGLAVYSKERNNRKYSDPMRVKRYLGAGLPVVMTGDFPFMAEVEGAGAGLGVEESVEGIRAGIEGCLENFERMSKCAYELAERYIVSERWVGL